MGQLWISGDFGFSSELLNYFLSFFPSWWTASISFWAIMGVFLSSHKTEILAWSCWEEHPSPTHPHPQGCRGWTAPPGTILVWFVPWILGIFPEDMEKINLGCWDTPVWQNLFCWELLWLGVISKMSQSDGMGQLRVDGRDARSSIPRFLKWGGNFCHN